MARLIFVNNNPYDVFVPTPNGAGRRVKVNEAVEGDYFIDLANTGMLTRYGGDPANVNIICSYKLSSYLNASESKQKTAAPVVSAAPVVPEVVPVVPEVVPVVPEVVPVVEPVVEEVAVTTSEPSALTPSDKDLMSLSMEELRMVAATMGLDPKPDVKKKTLVKMISSGKK